ncbi:hypothetical protein [Microbacterium terrisoli]|uniref:hypothetical protein n=1 Tax=Microbacterium terrisoli TaxID=3242192 RepID=UPI0028051C92|nr:hypothetical protein [Microbacterium protaetiae]
MQRIKEIAKAIAAVVGAVLSAGLTLIPVEWSPWLGLVGVIATAIATYSIPNAAPAVPVVDPSELD